jgi:hypothetical protein
VFTPLLVALALSGAEPQEKLPPPPKHIDWKVTCEVDLNRPTYVSLRVRGEAEYSERLDK